MQQSQNNERYYLKLNSNRISRYKIFDKRNETK